MTCADRHGRRSGDSHRRWLYVLATETYAPDSRLASLDLDGEIADVQATFELLGYPRHRHTVAAADDAISAVTALRTWLGAKNADDVVAVYVTGHAEVFNVNGRSRLGVHTQVSRAGEEADTIAPESLLVGLRVPAGAQRLRNLLLVLDVCGAGTGLMDAVGAVRDSLQVWPESRGTALGVHIVATARDVDRARRRSFASAMLDVVASPDLAPRTDCYLDLGRVLGSVQDHLTDRDQVLDSVSIGARGPNLCLPNPRHQLGGIDPVDLQAWWEPRARGDPPAQQLPVGVSAAVQPRWLFTGRRRITTRLAAWTADPADAPVLVITAGPGSGKSTVLARMVALTVPDIRRAMAATGHEPEAAQMPAAGFRFAVAVWAPRSGVTGILDRVRAAFDLTDGADLTELAARPPANDPPVVAIDAADEVDDPARLATHVLRPLAAAARRGVLRLVVATRRPPAQDGAPTGSGIDLITPLRPGQDDVLDLDDPAWREFGDIAAYADLLLSEPVNYLGRANPYADAPADRRVLARAIETAARHSFLLAASVARRHTLERERTDPDAPAWTRQFPETIGHALREEIAAGYGAAAAERWMALLRPLAFAQGPGLSRDCCGDQDLWARLATELSNGQHEFTSADVDGLLTERVATNLITRIDDSGAVVYRFHHESLADQFLARADVPAQHALITDLLLRSVRGAAGAWTTAGPYLRRALPEHARASGHLPALISDPAVLVHCDPEPLYAATAGSSDSRVARLRLLLRPLLHRLPGLDPNQRAFLLGVAARADPHTAALACDLDPLAVPAARAGPVAVRPAHDYLVLSQTPSLGRSLATVADRAGIPAVLGTATYDVEVWDPDDGVLLERLTPRVPAAVDLLPYPDPDGFPVLAISRSGGRVSVWDVTTRFPVAESPGDQPLGPTLCAGRLAPDRPFLVGSGLSRVAVWEPGRGPVRPLPLVGGHLVCVTTLPRPGTSDAIVVADANQVTLWDPVTLQPAGAFPTPDSLNVRVLGLGAHATDGVLVLATGLVDGGTWLMRPSQLTGHLLPGTQASTCLAAATGPTGQDLVALGFPDGSVAVTGTTAGDPWHVLRPHGPTVHAVTVLGTATGGPIVATADQAGQVQAWRLDDGQQLLDATGGERVDALALGTLRDGTPFLVTGSQESVRLWDLRRDDPTPTSTRRHVPHDPAPRSTSRPTHGAGLHSGDIYGLNAFTHAGRTWLVTFGADATLRVWDTATGACTVRAELPPDPSAALATWPTTGGRTQLAVTTGEGLFLLDALDGPYLQRDLPQAGVLAPVPSPSGDLPTLLAVAGHPGVHLLDAATGEPAHLLTAPANSPDGRASVTALVCVPLPDGDVLIAAGTETGVVWLWSLRDPTRDPEWLTGHDGPVLSLRAAPGSHGLPVLAAGSRHGTARIWDPTSARLLADCSPRPNPHQGTWQTFPTAFFARWCLLPDATLALVTDGEDHSRIDVRHTDGRPSWHHRYPFRVAPGPVAAGQTAHGQAFIALARTGGLDLIRPRPRAQPTHLPTPFPVQALAAHGSHIFAAGGGGFLALHVNDTGLAQHAPRNPQSST